nr:hypothetical protein [Flavimarina sp. Hel_I_48]
MQEYSRKFAIEYQVSRSYHLDVKRASLDIYKATNAQQQEARRVKGLSFGTLRKDMMHAFYSLWQNLVSNPESNEEADEALLTRFILKEEGAIYENDFLWKVLMDNLKLSEDSEELNHAFQNCTKIYHEDYPGSFVLMHNGRRLGICFLNIEKGINDTVEVSYQFNSNLTSFH